jgi:DNA recombination protein RmuC
MTPYEAVLVGIAAAAVATVVAVVVARRPSGSDAELRGLVQAHGARMDRLSDALGRQALDEDGLRRQLDDTRRAVHDLRARDEERRSRDEEARAALRRLESTFLGAATRGRVGENVVWEALAVLPPDMVDTDFRVSGKVVEFCLRLPDGRRLPIDSKWAGVAEVEALEAADGPDRQRLAAVVERLVAARAKEVAKYLDPSLTTPFAVAAVPDAVHAVLRRAHLEAFTRGVLLVPYSSALSMLLALYSLCCRLGEGGDIGAVVAEIDTALDGIERALENGVERGAKMAQNSAAEIRAQVGKARGALARGRTEDPAGPPRLRAVAEAADHGRH